MAFWKWWGVSQAQQQVQAAVAFARWHLGLIEWSTVLRGGVRLSGDRELRRALPSWNAAPERHREGRAQRVGSKV